MNIRIIIRDAAPNGVTKENQSVNDLIAKYFISYF